MEAPPVNGEGMSIGSLASRTGVPVDTLRAWERRYGVLRPWRTDGGQRRYGNADVERVLWLAARCAEGQRISDAVTALTTLAACDADAGAPVDALVARISATARQGDTARLEAELDRAFGALPLVQCMELVLFPALADLGRRWAAGEPTVVAEHILSGAAERRLTARLAAARRPRGPIGIIACPPGERHAVGALTLSVLMAQDGWRVSFLGADTPLEEAGAMAAARHAWVCVAVCTLPGTAARATAAISNCCNEDVWVLAGPDAPLPSEAPVPVWGPDFEAARLAAAQRAAQAAA